MNKLIRKLSQHRPTGFAVALIFLAWAIFFSPLLSGQYVYYLDDLKILYYPIEHAYAQFQANFSLPLWSPLFGFGQPLLAWAQLGFFTPLHVLLRALSVPPLTLLQVSVVSYFLIGLGGMYGYLTIRRFTPISAATGAIIYTFCGFAIGHLNHVNFYTGTMVLPWLLFAIHHLVEKPTWKRGIVTSIAASIIALSAQPQITLYCLGAAALIGICLAIQSASTRLGTNIGEARIYMGKLALITVASAIVWGCLASLSILPLREFLPSTERAGALSMEELLDFSYPPYHAVTLVLPYFFGDHDTYWGPKGFQELAAFIGLIPVFLGFGAFIYTPKKYRTEQVYGIILVILGIIIALGRYSSLYVWLVENHFVTSLANPGRFVFFFDLGMTFLAAIGMEKILSWESSTKTSRLTFTLAGLTGITVFAIPFLLHISVDSRMYKQLMSIFSTWQPQAIILWLSILTLIASFILLSRRKTAGITPYLLSTVTAISLVTYSWSYNPRTLTELTKGNTAFEDVLLTYAHNNNLPARLYARPELLRDTERVTLARTDEISALFSIYQPIRTNENNLSCIEIKLTRDKEPGSGVTVGIYDSLQNKPLRQQHIDAEDVISSDDTSVCFTPIPDSADKQYWVSITSTTKSGLYAVVQSSAPSSDNAYFIRKENPTSDQFKASQKLARLVYEPLYLSRPDLETALLERHINVTANTSSARWISALSVRWYREFIEEFFANDADTPIDGDGIHAIVRERKLLNLAGVTHLAQALPIGIQDTMPLNDFPQVATSSAGAYEAKLYSNPQAFPKVFVVNSAVWRSADDETRFAMMQPTFDPIKTVFVSGDTPPPSLPSSPEPFKGDTQISKYENTEVEVLVDTPQEAVLVLTDTWTPEWHVYVDGKPSLSLKADSVFRAALVPAGSHTVTFKYESAATKQAEILTLIGLAITATSCIPNSYLKKTVYWKR